MSSPHPDVLILNGAFEPEMLSGTVAGGEFIAFTQRSPDRETENEDTVGIIPFGPDAGILVVADGAGGLPAGKQASQLAVETLVRSLDDAFEGTVLLRTAIMNGIEQANEALLGLGSGAATTLTVVTIEGRQARSFQIGDSEALVTGQRGVVRLQTTAHSPTGFAVEAGFLDQRDALHHEDRHLVSNFMGTLDMSIDVGAAVELRMHDTVLVASDGITDNVHHDELVEMVRKGPLDRALEAVVGKSTARMTSETPGEPCKPDDLSLILFRKAVKRPSS